MNRYDPDSTTGWTGDDPATQSPPFASADPASTGTSDNDLRSRAIGRIRARRTFGISALWFLIVNTMLVYIWSRSGGFFWPVFPIMFWGMGLVWQAVDLFGGGMSEARIQAEMRRLGDSPR